MDSYRIGASDCDVDEQEETSTLRPESNHVEEWTDEKHNLFLKSMEAAFVDQLNKSLNLFGPKNSQARRKSSKHKFKVLRNGRWSNTDFTEGGAEASQDESRDLSGNPWIQHYRCLDRPTNRKILSSRAKDHFTTAGVNQDSACNFRLWRRDFVGTSAEVTDQNFDEEGLEEDKSDSAHEMKRTRTSIDNRVPSNGQVVPTRDFIGVDYVAEEHAQPED